MMDEPKKEEPSGPPIWMLSLADLISLLLTFFCHAVCHVEREGGSLGRSG